MSPLIDSFISSLIHLFSFFSSSWEQYSEILGRGAFKTVYGFEPFSLYFFFLEVFCSYFQEVGFKKKEFVNLNQFLASFLGLSSILQLQGI